MPTPAQVLEDAKLAEKLFQEQQDAITAHEKEAEAAAAVPDGTPAPVTGKPAEAVAETPVTPAPLVPVAEDFKHKYDVLKGKYDHEVPDIASKLSQALQKHATLEARIRDLETAKGTPAQPAVEVRSSAEVLADLERDPSVTFVQANFPDVWKATTLAIQKLSGPTDVSAKVDALQRSVDAQAASAAETRRHDFYAALDKVPNWSVINVSPEFELWLNTPDRYTGRSRRDLIVNAYERLDVNVVSSFFEDFQKEQDAAVVAAAVVPQDGTTPKKVVSPSPASTRTPADPGLNQKPILSATDVNKFYQDRIRGLWKGREKEMAEHEAVIELAVKEGRVR